MRRFYSQTGSRLLTAQEWLVWIWEHTPKPTRADVGPVYTLAHYTNGKRKTVKLICEKTLDQCRAVALESETCGYTLSQLDRINP